jgi:hypothetical protein
MKMKAIGMAIFAIFMGVTVAQADVVLINHTFNGGTGNLNGTAVNGGGSITGNWVTELGTNSEINANGTITTDTSENNLHQSAYVDLGSSIANGNLYELSVTMTKPTGTFYAFGFWDTATPAVAANHESNDGTAWALWRRNGRVDVNIGIDYDNNVGYDVFAGLHAVFDTDDYTTTTPQLFTIVLDLTAANGTDNWGNMTAYLGDSATGIVMGGLTNVAFDASQHFNAVGFSTRDADGQIDSLTLKDISTPDDLGSMTINVAVGTNLVLSWDGETGRSYAMQSRTNLVDGVWSNAMTGITGVTGTMSVTNSDVSAAQEFYRMILE